MAAASELFYREGIHSVGIERVLAQAGVAKASLYSTFGSKEELARVYLEQRAEARKKRILDRVAQFADPREQMLAVFDWQAELVANPAYRGCPFYNALAEGTPEGSKIASVCHETRAWLRELLTSLARAWGVDDPEALGRRLALIYDGVTIGASRDDIPALTREARAMAEMILERETPKSPRK